MGDTELVVRIANKKGLHARAAAKFVRTAEIYDAKVLVAKVAGAGVADGAQATDVSGGSILGLMMLGAECNSSIRLRISGAQAADAADALKKLVEDKFGED
ncbi:MAG TPA: HPr family phosphocarrier protein [Rickettsiales bacterium]|nr:HPr family phosphocarrier protein [Rickettsiales bacterium]